MSIDVAAFRNLPVTEVARLVRESGPKVCVFPINGTRRWFMLEHSPEREEDFIPAYLETLAHRHVEIYQLLFEHGLDTLLAPVFGPDLSERGDDYMDTAADGLAMLATHPAFLDFYHSYGVRVRFYGDHRRFFGSTPYAYLSDLFDKVTTQTLEYERHRLFFGVYAHDAIETVAELAIRYHAKQGRVPDKRTLIELYYGEYVAPVSLFIGFDKFCAFDMPLVATGDEDLYFTVSPSLYLTGQQVREILYDHLFSRRGGEPDYTIMIDDDWNIMREFYRVNLGRTLGVGVKQARGGAWYPLPQVELPTNLAKLLVQNKAGM